MHLGPLELPKRVARRAGVILRGSPRKPCPLGEIVQTVGILRSVNVMPSMFPEDEQFVEVFVGRLGAQFSALPSDFHG